MDFFLNGEFQKTIELCDNAIRNSSDKSVVLSFQILKGRCFLEMSGRHPKGSPDSVKQLRRSVEELTKAIELKESHEARHFRAVAYDLLGDKENYIKDRTVAVSLDPTYKYAYAIEPDSDLSETAAAIRASSDSKLATETSPEEDGRGRRVVADDPQPSAPTAGSLRGEDGQDTTRSAASSPFTSAPLPEDRSWSSAAKSGFTSQVQASGRQSATKKSSVRSGVSASTTKNTGVQTTRTLVPQADDADSDLEGDDDSLSQDSSGTDRAADAPSFSPYAPIAPWKTSIGPVPGLSAPQNPASGIPTPTTGLAGPTISYQPPFPNLPTTGYAVSPNPATTPGTIPFPTTGTGAPLARPNLAAPGFSPSALTPALPSSAGIGYTGALPFEQRKLLGLPAERLTAPYQFPPQTVNPYAGFPTSAFSQPVMPPRPTRLVKPFKPGLNSVLSPKTSTGGVR
jgi:hypothetical protein